MANFHWAGFRNWLSFQRSKRTRGGESASGFPMAHSNSELMLCCQGHRHEGESSLLLYMNKVVLKKSVAKPWYLCFRCHKLCKTSSGLVTLPGARPGRRASGGCTSTHGPWSSTVRKTYREQPLCGPSTHRERHLGSGESQLCGRTSECWPLALQTGAGDVDCHLSGREGSRASTADGAVVEPTPLIALIKKIIFSPLTVRYECLNIFYTEFMNKWNHKFLFLAPRPPKDWTCRNMFQHRLKMMNRALTLLNDLTHFHIGLASLLFCLRSLCIVLCD